MYAGVISCPSHKLKLWLSLLLPQKIGVCFILQNVRLHDIMDKLELILQTKKCYIK